MYSSNSNQASPHLGNSLLGKFCDTGSINVAVHLEKEKLSQIAKQIRAGIDEDKSTMENWLSEVKEAQDLIKLKKQIKTVPFENASNVKFPLITNACLQFAARTYSEIIRDDKVVKGQVLGKDEDGSLTEKALRIAQHMSWQLLNPNSDWEASTDKLLVMLPAVGFLLKKTFFDPVKKCNSSLLCNYEDIIIRNAKDTQCLYDLQRITHVLYYHSNDLIQFARKKIFLEDVVEELITKKQKEQVEKACKFYEVHCYLDLDSDGYKEPYIVTMDADTDKIARIFARYRKQDIEFNDDGKVVYICPIQCFTDFHYLPSPDGTFMSIGFGSLMLHIQEAANTILNELIDAGKLANLQGGFIDARLKFEGGDILQDPGQWNRVKGVSSVTLKEGVLPINYKEPSTVLFQLLGLLIESAKELSSSTEIMQGTQNAQNVPATTIMALVEQGMKVFNSIQKRLYRSLKLEYNKLFKLNQIYCDPVEYFDVVGQGKKQVYRTDYDDPSITIIPVADPSLSSDAQRFARMQFLLQLTQQPATNAYMNVPAVIQFGLQIADMPNPEMFIKQAPPAPDPKLIKVQADAKHKDMDLSIKARNQQLKEHQFLSDLPKKHAETQEMQAKAVKFLADASSVAHDAKQSDKKLSLDIIKTKLDHTQQMHQQLSDHVNQQKDFQLQQQELEQQQQQLDQQNQQQDQNQGNSENQQSNQGE